MGAPAPKHAKALDLAGPGGKALARIPIAAGTTLGLGMNHNQYTLSKHFGNLH